MCTYAVRINILLISIISIFLSGCSQAFDIADEAVKKELIQIETKKDGTGDKIDNTYEVNMGDTVDLHAVYRNEDGEFVKNIEVAWRLIGGIGSLTILSNGTSASFTSNTSGTAVAEILYKDVVIKTVNIIVEAGLPILSFQSTSLSANEGENATLVFELSSVHTEDVTFDIATSQGTATSGSDYTAITAQTVTIPQNSTQTSVNIPLTVDNLYEGANESFSVAISNIINAQSSVTSASVTIVDMDSRPDVGVSGETVAESNGTASFTVSLTHASTETSSVDYVTSDDTAVSSGGNVDYTSASGTLTFLPGETSKSIAISINSDSIDEDNESFALTISNAINLSSISQSVDSVTITDDDASPTISISDVTVEEGENATLTLTLSSISGRATAVDWQTQDNSATAGSDYTAQTLTTLNIPAYTSSIEVTVSTIDDDVYETSHSFNVVLSNPSSLDSITDSTGVVTLTDNDPAPVNDVTVTTFDISNVSTSGFDVSLNYANDDNDNSTSTLYYCNQTDTPLCDPTAGDSLSLTKGSSTFTGSVTGLTTPYDSGDVVYVSVVTSDVDGVTSINTKSKVTLSAPTNSITLNDFQVFNIVSNGFEVSADFTGDSNNNATATVYYCNRTYSTSCDPLTDDSKSMEKFGTTFRATINDLIPDSYPPGNELNIAVQLSDVDGSSGSPMTSRITLVSGLNDYPNANALIGLWQLNDSPATHNSTIVDLTGKHNGTLVSNDGSTNKSDTGIVGQCISLDGSDDNIIIPGHTDFDIPTGAKMTFMGWYSRSGTLGAEVASGMSTGASSSSFAPVFHDSTTIGFWDGSATRLQTSVTNGIGEWHHFTVTYDAGNVKMYWDGVEVVSGSVNNVNETAFDFRIGGDNWGYFTHIKADEVSFWKRVLTPQEINSIYNAQKSP